MSLDIELDRSRPIHLQIGAHMRRQIETGVLKPGEPLPSTTELSRLWGVNFRTVQKALSRLKKSSLLQRTPGKGTYVSPAARPVVSLAVLFGPGLANEGSHFYRAMVKALRDEAAERGWRCRVYDGFHLYGSSGFKDTPAHALFMEDHGRHEFNGVITVGVDGYHWDILKPEISAHVVRYGAASTTTDVSPDISHFTYAAAEYLAGLGLRRIAYLRTHGTFANNPDMKVWRVAARRFKFESVPMMQVKTHVHNAYLERDTYRLVIRQLQKWRKSGRWPEAIVISDDIAARAVALALIRHRLDVPDGLRLLTWANEGIDIHYGFPVIRYMVSPADIASRLAGILEQRLAGESPRGLPTAVRGRIVETEAAEAESSVALQRKVG